MIIQLRAISGESMVTEQQFIERDSSIKFHEIGTLKAVTRWINRHEDGFPELMKNVRRAYQEDRANVAPKHRVAVLMLYDGNKRKKIPARLGLLDVGGATLDDVEIWSVWQDPDASSRGSRVQEEITQGNGGKAYMYSRFRGPTYILGIKDEKRNCKGFVGPNDSLERGIPGFIPNQSLGKDASIDKLWDDELVEQLVDFGLDFASLPNDVKTTLKARKAFTIVCGINPIDWGKKADVKNFIKKVSRHPQSTLALKQVKFYAYHNGKILFNGKPLELEPIPPYPGIEGPFEHEIPEMLLSPSGNQVNTTKSSSGKHPKGKIILYTSKDDMETAFKVLKPRWKVAYRTKFQIVGEKSIPEIVPTTPGSHFIYAEVILDSLDPDYVRLGRDRPNDGPLINTVDMFLTEKIKHLAQKIYELRKQKLSESTLDEIFNDNKFLNDLKNEFLPEGGEFGFESGDGGGNGKDKKTRIQVKWGSKAAKIEVSTYKLSMTRGFTINLAPILGPTVKDKEEKPVRADLIWSTDNKNILELSKNGDCKALGKGTCKLWVSVAGTMVKTPPIEIEIRVLKDVILSPRNLQVPVGHSKEIIPQIIDDGGKKSTEVLLNWRHSADNKNIVKISPRGHVFGNIIGKTLVSAGVNDPKNGDLWSNIPTEVEVIKSDDEGERGKGHPQLLLTDREDSIDPETGEKRVGEPEEPALWQLPHDLKHNIWWLNMQSRDAAFAHELRPTNLVAWRIFHAKILIEMMIQVHMLHEYTKKGDAESPDFWSNHKQRYERFAVYLTHPMWEKLQNWIRGGD